MTLANLAHEIFTTADHDLDRALAELMDLSCNQFDDTKLAGYIKDLVQLRIELLHSSRNSPKIQQELKFLAREKWVWTLLELMTRIRGSTSSQLYQCTQLRTYMEALIAHHGVTSETDMHDDIEDEIDQLLSINPIINFFAGSRKRRRSQALGESELMYQQIFRALKSGDTQKALSISREQEPEAWRTGLLAQYIQARERALDGKHIEWLAEQHKAWDRLYEHKESQNNLGQYEAAILGVLSGNTKRVLPICSSWEDVIWAYYNGRAHQAAKEQALGETGDSAKDILVEEEYMDVASSKGDRLQDGYVRLFATLTLSILQGKLQDGISYCCSLLLDAQAAPGLAISQGSWMRPFALRLLSTLTLYGRILHNQAPDPTTDKVLGLYAAHSVTKPSFKPKVLALYASYTPPAIQIPAVSDFLAANFWDSQERALLLDMGKQFGLDMVAILRQTWEKTLESFFDKHSAIHKPPRGIQLFDDDDDDSHPTSGLPYGVKRCLMQFAWLLMDDHLYFYAIRAANKLAAHFIDTKQPQAARALLSSIPGSVVDMAILQADGATTDLPSDIRQFENISSMLRI